MRPIDLCDKYLAGSRCCRSRLGNFQRRSRHHRYDLVMHNDPSTTWGDVLWDSAGMVPELGSIGALFKPKRVLELAHLASKGRQALFAAARPLWASYRLWNGAKDVFEGLEVKVRLRMWVGSLARSLQVNTLTSASEA
jgi:hypothetical protein